MFRITSRLYSESLFKSQSPKDYIFRTLKGYTRTESISLNRKFYTPASLDEKHRGLFNIDRIYRISERKKSIMATIDTSPVESVEELDVKFDAEFVSPPEQVNDNDKYPATRLPNHTTPKHYDLILKPNLTDFNFTGSVRISIDKSKPCDHVLLNANQVQIIGGYCVPIGSSEPVKFQRIVYNSKSETAAVEFEKPVSGIQSLVIKFSGLLNDKMKGFYRTAYQIEGETLHAATTQFEATEARRCFPCFDEPEFKATFRTHLKYKNEFQVGNSTYKNVAISNTKLVKQRTTETENIDEFEVTPKMSSYLLAFVIGPLEYIESTFDGGRRMRVYTFPGKKEQGRFALDVACKSVVYFEKYFGIDYPLDKLDLVAIPDFSGGAMENWGLITYRETCLLFDPEKTSNSRKQFIAIVVGHEISHQWFGNLVTMKWWTDLWLKEGFASFMEYSFVNDMFPEYDIWSQFVSDNHCSALELDSLHNSHPIEVPVTHASEIDEIFDQISYEKGASVIRMLHNYIGDDDFRLGLKNYLNKFKYSNATTEDLWNSLGESSQKNIREFMGCWTLQKGYPWLSVKVVGDKRLQITQSKFTADGKLAADESNILWQIPISITNGKEVKPSKIELMSGKSIEIDVPELNTTWVKFNPGNTSFYRTAYPPDLLAKLVPAISDQSLPAMDRLNLQNDSFALCHAGNISTLEYLKLLQAYKAETNYTVWSSISCSVSQLDILLANTNYREHFHSFGRKLYEKIFQTISWDKKPNESHTDTMLRASVINSLVNFGHQGVIEHALKMFKNQLSNKVPISPDLRGPIYKAVSMQGDDEDFKNLFQICLKDDLQEEKNRAARALGFAKKRERVEKVIDFVLSDGVRNQDKVSTVVAIACTHPEVAWKLLQDKKDYFRDKYESGFLMRTLVKCTTEVFATKEKYLEVENFFKNNEFQVERTIQQSLECIRLNTAWLERDGSAIEKFLKSNN